MEIVDDGKPTTDQILSDFTKMMSRSDEEITKITKESKESFHKIQKESKERQKVLYALVGFNAAGSILWLYGISFGNVAVAYAGLGLMVVGLGYFMYKMYKLSEENP